MPNQFFSDADKSNLKWFWSNYMRARAKWLILVLLLIIFQGFVYQQFLVLTESGLRVIFAANRPDGSEIEVYHKTQEAGADAPFGGLNWVQATIDTVVPSTDDPTQFNDYEYTVDLTSSPFQIVAIKVVFKSQSSTHVPRIKDFRVIALGT